MLRHAAGCPHLRRNPGLVTALTAHAEVELERYLSINTVKGYTEILYRKLGVSTLQEAVRQARALGLL